MTLQLQVPSIVCSGCVDAICKAIQTNLPEAEVSGDLTTKTITVTTTASEDTVKEIITAVGHTVA